MKKLLVLFFLLIFCSIAQAYTIQDGIKCTMGSDPLLNTDTEGATFTCVNTSATGTPVLTGCADTATGLCLLTAYSASCSQPSSCVKVERFTVKTVSGTTTYTFTIKARDLYDSRRSSANWVQGDKVEMIHMAGEDNNPNIPGTVTLPPTTSSTTGVIYKDTNPFIHNYAATNTWGWNTFIGVNSGNFTMARVADDKEASVNVGVGENTLKATTTGHHNVAVGMDALSTNTTGYENTAVGLNSMNLNVVGSENTAIGTDTLQANTVGYVNSAVGMGALNLNTEGYRNAAMGAYALSANLTGYRNTALGYGAGNNITTGHENLMIGYIVQAPSATGSHQMNIGGVITSPDMTVGNVSILGDLTVTGGDITGNAATATGISLSGAGAPSAGDCDAVGELGKLYIDTTNHKFYWCEGAAGWKFVTTE